MGNTRGTNGMKGKKHYNYTDIAEFLEANGQKEAADRLRTEFSYRERGLCRKAVDFLKEKWEPLDGTLKLGLSLLFSAGISLFLFSCFEVGFLPALKGTLVILAICALGGGVIVTILGVVIRSEKPKGK